MPHQLIWITLTLSIIIFSNTFPITFNRHTNALTLIFFTFVAVYYHCLPPIFWYIPLTPCFLKLFSTSLATSTRLILSPLLHTLHHMSQLYSSIFQYHSLEFIHTYITLFFTNILIHPIETYHADNHFYHHLHSATQKYSFHYFSTSLSFKSNIPFTPFISHPP